MDAQASQALTQLALFALEEAVKYAPQLAEEISGLLTRSDATTADWQALRDKYKRRAYESVVTESGLIPTELPPTSIPQPPVEM